MEISSLSGQLLVAMPSLADPNFFRTIVLLASHSVDSGAFGLVVNRPTGIEFSEILDQLGLNDMDDFGVPEILLGGPVQPDHGFLLMPVSERPLSEDDLQAGDFSISGRTDLLRDLLVEGFSTFHLCLGYSGWAPGQLEAEIEDNAWLIAPGSKKIVFDTPAEKRWEATLSAMGINPGALIDMGPGQPA